MLDNYKPFSMRKIPFFERFCFYGHHPWLMGVLAGFSAYLIFTAHFDVVPWYCDVVVFLIVLSGFIVHKLPLFQYVYLTLMFVSLFFLDSYIKPLQIAWPIILAVFYAMRIVAIIVGRRITQGKYILLGNSIYIRE